MHGRQLVEPGGVFEPGVTLYKPTEAEPGDSHEASSQQHQQQHQQQQQRAQTASTQHQPSSIVPDKVAAIPWQPPDEPPEGCDPDPEIFEGLKRIFRDPGRFPPQTKSDEVLKAAGYSCWQEYYFSMMCFYAE